MGGKSWGLYRKDIFDEYSMSLCASSPNSFRKFALIHPGHPFNSDFFLKKISFFFSTAGVSSDSQIKNKFIFPFGDISP